MPAAIITAYCACVLCCGPTAPSPTASGNWPVAGITIAAPANIPLGTKVAVSIPGKFSSKVFTVQDRTAKKYNGRWDIYMPTHQEAQKFGIRRGTVRIIKRR